MRHRPIHYGMGRKNHGRTPALHTLLTPVSTPPLSPIGDNEVADANVIRLISTRRTSADPNVWGNSEELTKKEQRVVEKIHNREMRAHEQVRRPTTGPYARDDPRYEHARGSLGYPQIRSRLRGQHRLPPSNPIKGHPESTTQKCPAREKGITGPLHIPQVRPTESPPKAHSR